MPPSSLKTGLHGNASAVYTTSGDIAQRVINEVSAGMCGVNIGVPVPREPFGFEAGMTLSSVTAILPAGTVTVSGHGLERSPTSGPSKDTTWMS